MKFTDAGGYSRHLEVRPIELLPDKFEVTVWTQWEFAKNPDYLRRAITMTVDYKGLLALRNTLQRAIQDRNDKEDSNDSSFLPP